MKRMISFILAVVMLCSIAVVSVSAVEGDSKTSRRTEAYLAEFEDTDVVRMNIEMNTDIKIMDSWEYYWENGVNMTRFINDKEYANEWGMAHYEYEQALYKEREVQLLDFYNNYIKISDDYDVLVIPSYNVIRAFVRVCDIEKIASYDDVISIYSNLNYDGFGNDVIFGADGIYKVIGENYCEEYLGLEFNPETDSNYIRVHGSDCNYIIFQGCAVQNEGYSEEVIGNLIIGSEFTHTPDNPTGYFAIGDGEYLMTLTEALEKKRIRLGTVAYNFPYVYLIGDADYDYNITIMDATMIQRILAGIDEYKDVVCASRPEDKDRDGNVTIMDATDIQREIAQIK